MTETTEVRLTPYQKWVKQGNYSVRKSTRMLVLGNYGYEAELQYESSRGYFAKDPDGAAMLYARIRTNLTEAEFRKVFVAGQVVTNPFETYDVVDPHDIAWVNATKLPETADWAI